MKTTLLLSILLPAFLLLPPDSDAGTGGVYRGVSKNNVINPKGFAKLPFGNAPIRLRLPSGKGKISGAVLTSKLAPDARDLPIVGRVTKYTVRQGGNHVILSGNWEWNLKPLGAERPARGPFRFSVRKSGNTYRIAPAEKVKVKAGGFMAYTFTSKISAKK